MRPRLPLPPPGAINQRGAIQGVSGTGNVVAGLVSFTTTTTRIGVDDGASLELSGPITEATPGLALTFHRRKNADVRCIVEVSQTSQRGPPPRNSVRRPRSIPPLSK